MNSNELILFESQDKTVILPVQLQDDTVWLNRNQMTELFGRDVKTIGKHIGNALKEELDDSTVAKFATVQVEGERTVQRIMTESLKAVVLETFGAENIPASQNSLLPIIKKAYENGTIMTVCSQCLQGRVSLGTYETSRGLSEVGAVSGADLTTEAAVTKLYYLFSAGYTKEEIKEKMAQNLCGEMTE